MRVLLLAQSFNSLTQRVFVELEARGHEVSVELDINDAVTLEAVALFAPEIIVAPFLKRRIPASVWRNCPCLIVHPGIRGDRGPSALDWPFSIAAKVGASRSSRHERSWTQGRRGRRLNLPCELLPNRASIATR